MSRVIKKKIDHSNIRVIKKDVENENKKINKLWTLEGITFIAFIATIISSYILFALSTWTQVNLIPKRNAQYSQYEVFQQNRMQVFEEFRKTWTDMRAQFTNYIYHCTDKNTNKEILEQDYEENDKRLDRLREITAGEVIPYYFGTAIGKIHLAEIRWYEKNEMSCPTKDRQEGINLIFNLYHRENALMKLFLQKAFSPYNFDKYHDNKYYLY